MLKKLFAALCIIGLLFSAAPASAGSAEDNIDESVVVLDVLIVRPLGLASVALGLGVFVISLPFTIPTWSVGRAADKLIVAPVKFTFARPIGEMQD